MLDVDPSALLDEGSGRYIGLFYTVFTVIHLKKRGSRVCNLTYNIAGALQSV